jgi:hypothetical protein
MLLFLRVIRHRAERGRQRASPSFCGGRRDYAGLDGWLSASCTAPVSLAWALPPQLSC